MQSEITSSSAAPSSAPGQLSGIELACAAALGLWLAACEDKPAAEPVTASSATLAASAEGKECCMGKNDCKGKGGCAVAESHACQGQNECKGKGGCDMHCPQ